MKNAIRREIVVWTQIKLSIVSIKILLVESGVKIERGKEEIKVRKANFKRSNFRHMMDNKESEMNQMGQISTM